jgi:hypothetical protein
VPTQSLGDRARVVIPGGVNSGHRQIPGSADLAITRSSGAHFIDQHARAYVDYHAAFGSPLLGFHAPDVEAAVRAATTGVDLPGVAVTPGEVLEFRCATPSVAAPRRTCPGTPRWVASPRHRPRPADEGRPPSRRQPAREKITP